MISKKTINAIEVCVLLAGQHHGYLSTTDLSQRLGLSISHLENILKPLREHNIVMAMKGPGGGYRINGDVSRVSIWDIAAIFEQTLEDAQQENSAYQPYEFGLEQVVKETLLGFALSDFVDASGSDVRSLGQVMGRFKFKPLEEPFVPKAPNSVFQLHMSF